MQPSVGSFVWLEDPDVAWIDGQVVEVKGLELKVLCSSGKMVLVKASDVYAKDTEAPPSGVDDMTKLAYLHEPGVLQNLRSRYDKNEIYMAQYKVATFGERSPHPFAVADAAYRLMINGTKHQSIPVSGESGAGKTESTKLLMRYLAFMGGRAAAEGRTVEQQLLESNPVLEAFGNAKTERSNNSRSDYLSGRISGAAVRTYLLERSRVCHISERERNYHCFYMLCAAPKEDIQRFKLGHPTTFHYLNQSNCFALDGIDDSEEYIATRQAMDIVGIRSHEQDAIFRVVAAILHLGNTEFVEGKEFDSSTPKDEKSWFHLKTAAELLMCDMKALEDSLCKHVIVTGGETITKFVNPDSAAGQRDALAKIVYSRLFDWIVDKLNNSIGQDPDSKSSIGVLDIYGFESFETNSFEQFCINLTNEKLQQHFNQHVFKMEQEEYTKEEIAWSYIDFVDNRDVLDLIEKKPGGIIALLDEVWTCVTYTYTTTILQSNTVLEAFGNARIMRNDNARCDYLREVDMSDVLFVGIFPFSVSELIIEPKILSLNAWFKQKLFSPHRPDPQQLHNLLETLSATQPHYIRCVKPNNLLKPAIFEKKNVQQQLRCGGVVEASRIRHDGYLTRRPFVEFMDRFGILAHEVLDHRYLESFCDLSFMPYHCAYWTDPLVGKVLMRLPSVRGLWKKWD
ncbi:hypothetical protein ACJRO7_030218 [Eucalyptus globulus]|uniref:Myosin motor domain-containing protein n=1 Tax=Eucalyptus globulus TaxID=34317 RepID=A0ABD3JGR6_EUCGL